MIDKIKIRQKQQRYRNNNREKVKEAEKLKRRKKLIWFNNIKSKLQCIKCGFSHIAALDFHHRVPSEKKFELANIWGKTRKQILEELEKCDVLCANCHRILHYEEKHLGHGTLG
jgi:hypothetical protein